MSKWGTCIANETSKKLVHQFRFPCHVAPGEAEAECALLQKRGMVDMVMSQDGDAIMFGSQLTLRDWSKEGTRGNKSPTHVNLLDLPRLQERSGLDPDGMILVALLSGGDYDQDGVAGFGPGLACEAARAGFGADLLELVRKDDEAGLQEWRERFQFELETNESGYFKRRHKTLKLPNSFPDRTLVGYYVNPAVSENEDLKELERKLSKTWDEDINIPELRRYVGDTFDWLYKPGAWKFVRGLAPPLLAHRLHRGLAGLYVTSVDQIRERRQHFTNDGIPELRVAAVPADVVGLDLDIEEDSPERLARIAGDQEHEDFENDAPVVDEEGEDHEDIPVSQQPRKQRKASPWSPSEPEKMWIPETIVQLGVPALVEEWHQIERDTHADPKEFAARKSKKNNVKVRTRKKAARIENYFVTSKVTTASQGIERSPEAVPRPKEVMKPVQQPQTPTKKQPETSLQSSSPDIKHFFKVTKPVYQRHQPGSLASAADAIKALEVARRCARTPNLEPCLEVAADAIKALDVARRHLKVPNLDPLAAKMPVLAGEGLSSTPATQPNSPGVMSLPPALNRRNEVQPAPSTPQKGACIILEEDGDALPDSITRRKRRNRQDKPRVNQQQPSRVMKDSETLKSFFQSKDVVRNHSFTPPPEPSPFACARLPCELSTGLQVDFLRKKLHAVPRESLPGTWRDIDLEEDVLSVKSKRTTRVSYVDLAKD